MNRFILSAVVLIALAALICGGHAGKHCTDSSQCEDDECCLDPTQRRGKRQAAGYCAPRVLKGQSCFINAANSGPVYLDACPCVSGLTCQGNGVISVPQGEMGTCG
ncbi:venom protein 164 [Aplysia californica]|uniref:Venom protein 164 n=1 Tax=Aplysia californica TaxID=6500 RepID=A0ABM0K0X8_APLCA|nr:venom protein 164 [Aplysia californica]